MKTIKTGGPMLASNEIVTDFDTVSYPVVASPKVDGWRCYADNGPRTRKGFLIPNLHTRAMLMSETLQGLDGELVSGSVVDPASMQKAQSAFSSIEGVPDFTWYVFDNWTRLTNPFWDSWTTCLAPRKDLPSFIKLLPQELISNAQALERFSNACKQEGFEGAIIRSPDSPYKNGRSTTKQGWMLKVKPYVYEEATIISLNEKKRNLNPLEQDNFGFAKRSHSKDGKVPADTLGSFTVKTKAGMFNIGCGHLIDIEKRNLWGIRHSLLGKQLTFKYLKHGTKNVPRHGQFVSFRAEVDT